MSNRLMPVTLHECKAEIRRLYHQLDEARDLADKLQEAAQRDAQADTQNRNRIYVLEQDINRKDACIRDQQEEIDQLKQHVRDKNDVISRLKQERDDQAATIRGLERRCAGSSTVQADDDQRVSELELGIDAYRTALRAIANGHLKLAQFAQLMLKLGD